MGKSSLRQQTTQLLSSSGLPTLCGTVDILGLGTCQNRDQWYAGFAYELMESFEVDTPFDWDQEWKQQQVSPVRRLRLLIEHLLQEFPSHRIVIFVDEIDAVQRQSFRLDDFFTQIRYFYDHRSHDSRYNRLTFALLGVASPNDLMREHSGISMNSGGVEINLTGFELTQTQPLQRGLEGVTDAPGDVMQEILAWTDGQPFLTQKVCNLIVQEETSLNVEEIINRYIIQDWVVQDEPEHLRSIRNRILDDDKRHTARLLELYRDILNDGSIEAENSFEHKELRLSGLVIQQDNQLRVFNRVYRNVFNLEWVNQQLDELPPQFYARAIKQWANSANSRKARETYLLKGKKLEEAQEWAFGRSLRVEDYQFLEKSQRSQANRMIQNSVIISAGIVTASLFVATITSRQVVEARRDTEIAQQEAQKANQDALRAEQREQESNERLQQANDLLASVETERDQAEKERNQAQVEQIQAKAERDQAQTEREQADIERVQAQTEREQAEIARTQATEERDIANRETAEATYARNVALGEVAIARQDLTVAQAGTQLERQGNDALARFEADQVAGLVAAMEATVSLKELVDSNDLSLADYPATSPIFALREMFEQLWQVDIVADQKELISSAKFNPSGDLIISTSADNIVRLFDTSGNLLTYFGEHQDRIHSVQFHPTESKILTASANGTARLWDTSGQTLAILKGHQGDVYQAVFSPNGEYIATASADDTARIWNSSGETIAVLDRHQADVRHISFSPDSQYVAVTSADGVVGIWNLSGQPLGILQIGRIAHNATFSPDGEFLVTASDDQTVQLWNWKELIELRQQHGYSIVKSTYVGLDRHNSGSAMDQTIAYTEDGWFDISTDITPATYIELGGRCAEICGLEVEISPNSQYLLLTSKDSLMLGDDIAAVFDRSGHCVTTLRGHNNSIWAGRFSADSQRIVTVSSDATARVWDLTGRQLTVLMGHREAVFDAQFSPDGNHLLTYSMDKTLRIWHFAKSRPPLLTNYPCLNSSLNQCFTDAKFSPNGQQVITIPVDQNIAELWDLTGQKTATLQGHHDRLYKAEFSHNGQRIITTSLDNTARVWTQDGQLLSTLRDHGDYIDDAHISSNGDYIVTMGNDYSVHLWKAEGEQIASFLPDLINGDESKQCNRSSARIDLSASAAFSHDSRFVAMSHGSNAVRVVDLLGREIARFQAHDSCVQRVRFSPTENLVVTASDDGTAKVWTLEGELLSTLEGHRANVIDAVFSPDGQYIQTSSYDQTARIWTLAGEELAALGGSENCKTEPTKRNCIYAIKFGPDSQSVFTVSDENVVRMWNLRGQLLADYADPISQIHNISASPDGKSVLVLSNEEVRVWHLKRPEELVKDGCDWLRSNKVLEAGSDLVIPIRSLDGLFGQPEQAICSPEVLSRQPLWSSN